VAPGAERIVQSGGAAPSPRFSSYLRKCRQERRLSLRQVERLSESFPERISNSYLAYCETGRLLPSLGKLITLSKVLGVPLQNFTERLELDREAVPAPDLGAGATWRDMRAAGIARVESGHLQAAFACFEKATGMTGAEDHLARIDLAMDMAIVLKKMSRHYTARDVLEEVLSEKRVTAERTDRALLVLGGVLREMGKLPIAVMVAREALIRAEADGDLHKEGHAACLLANALHDLGNHAEAAPLYHNAIRIFKDAGDLPSFATNLANLGNCLCAQHQYTEGIRRLREAEAIAEEGGFERQLADINSYLGLAYKSQGITSRAAKCFYRSNQIARAGDYDDIIFTNTWHLREIALKSGRQSEAADLMRSLRYHRARVESTSGEIAAFDEMMNRPAQPAPSTASFRPKDEVVS